MKRININEGHECSNRLCNNLIFTITGKFCVDCVLIMKNFKSNKQLLIKDKQKTLLGN